MLSVNYQRHRLLLGLHAADRVHRLQHASDRECRISASVEPPVQRGGEHNPDDNRLQREGSSYIREAAEQGHLLLLAAPSFLHGVPRSLNSKSLLPVLVELSVGAIAREKLA